MHRWTGAAISIVVFAALVGCAPKLAVCPWAGPMATEGAAREAVESGLVPSLSWAVVWRGGVQEVGVFGSADLASDVLATEDTLYEAASLTKPVVAWLALQLVDAGVIELDESVAASVPAPRIHGTERERWLRVTPRHLLSHASGLPNWSGSAMDADRSEPLAFAFEPGSDFAYSGEGYGLLGRLIERKSGRTLEALSRELFDTLGMHASTLVGARAKGPVARGHWGRSPSRASRRLERPVPAHSMLTTATDYARFLGWVSRGGGLSPALWAEARRVQVRVRPTWLRGPERPARLG